MCGVINNISIRLSPSADRHTQQYSAAVDGFPPDCLRLRMDPEALGMSNGMTTVYRESLDGNVYRDSSNRLNSTSTRALIEQNGWLPVDSTWMRVLKLDFLVAAEGLKYFFKSTFPNLCGVTYLSSSGTGLVPCWSPWQYLRWQDFENLSDDDDCESEQTDCDEPAEPASPIRDDIERCREFRYDQESDQREDENQLV